MDYKLLVINPGSTSTKIGVYEDEKPILVETLRHASEEIEKYSTIIDQFEFRKNVILDVLKEKDFDLNSLDAIVGRGGLLKPIEGGTYEVNETMLEDLRIGVQGQHASNIGGILANEIAKELGIPSYIVDPVVVNEMDDIAKLSGIPEIQRKSIFHALNQKAVAKRYAKENNVNYEDINLIVAHLGGGVSVGAHKNGRVVDTNNTLDGDGPYSPERSGGIPVGDLIKMCFSGKFTEDEMKKKITGKGGFVAYMNTNDAREVYKSVVNGDQKAKLIYEGIGYQVAKEIGAAAAVLSGKVNAIIITGGIAYNEYMVQYIKEKVSFISPVIVYPGEDELLALTEGALRVLRGEEKAKIYK